MTKKRLTHIKIRPEDKVKVQRLKFKVQSIQGRKVTDDEILKRTFNIPNIDLTLKHDAKAKKRLGI